MLKQFKNPFIISKCQYKDKLDQYKNNKTVPIGNDNNPSFNDKKSWKKILILNNNNNDVLGYIQQDNNGKSPINT